MAISRLSLYNNALFILGARHLTSEYESRPARKVLDEIYGQEAVGVCLELAKPRFAQKTAKLSTPTTSLVHSLDQVYTLPTDYLALIELYADEALQQPVERRIIEGRTIATEIATNVYLKYIASTITMSDWSPAFADLVSSYLAHKASVRIAPDKQAIAEKAFKDSLGAVLELEGAKEREPLARKAIATLTDHWISVVNGALQLLGQPQITANTDQTPARVALDYVLKADFSGVNVCLEMARPRFAMTTATLTGGSTSAQHGYTDVHTLPSDYVTIVDVHSDSSLDTPVSRYFIDGGTIATNYDSIYLRYIQNDAATTLWSPGFTRYVSAYLASVIAPEFATGESATEREAIRQNIRKELADRLAYVQENEAVKEPPRRPQASTFTLTDAWRVVYNRALAILELEPILTNTDDSQRRSALDNTVTDGIVGTVLSKIIWNFACVRAALTRDDAYEASFGFAYRFEVPATVHRVDAISPNEYFTTPCEYTREGDYYYSDCSTLYIRYVSTAFLTTPGDWPDYFRDYLAAEMATLCTWLPGANKQNVERMREKYKREAFATDAQSQPPRQPATGRWAGARGGSTWGIDNGRFRQR